MVVFRGKQNGDSVFVWWSSWDHRHFSKRYICDKFTQRCSRKIALSATVHSFD